MSTQALAEAHAESTETPAPPSAASVHPVVLGIASGLLLWMSFPSTGWSWLAWVALAPLFFLVKSRRSAASLYGGAWAGGLTFWLLAIHWVRLTDPDAWLGWVVMAGVLSLWWPAFLLVARIAVLRFRVPLLAAAPAAWVALEYVRAHILSGFPWYYLAHSQHEMLVLIQIADISGALGLSAIMALVNAWVAECKTAPMLEATPNGRRLARPQLARALVAVLAVGATCGYGLFRLATARFEDGPRVALLQSNLIQSNKMSANPPDLLMLYKGLVERALRTAHRPDLIVWPETSNPYHYIVRDPALDHSAFARLVQATFPDRDPAWWMEQMHSRAALLHGWTDTIGVPMLVGMLTYEFTTAGFAKYNTAVLVEPSIPTVQRYAKVYLVPFGEYVPLVKLFPWLSALTPYQGSYVPSLAFGRSQTPLSLGRYRLAPAICFEDTIPHAVRPFFAPRSPESAQPDVLINLTNDGWFHGSSEHDMHLAVSVFRAVENRVPLARAVNTGPSAIVDGNGAVLASQPKLTEGVLSGVVPLDQRTSFYSKQGDWLGTLSLATTLTVLLAWGADACYRRARRAKLC